MTTPTTNTELLKSHAAELVKQYITYDASSRVEYVYTANINVGDQGACIVTQYSYSGVTTNIVKRKESYGTWLTAYDL